MNTLKIMALRPKDRKLDWKAWETKLNYPPVFKIFNDTFLIESIFETGVYAYLRDNRTVNFGVYTYHFENPSINISNYYGPESIEGILPSLIQDEYEKGLLETGYLPIGISHSNQYLLLGTKGELTDKIFFETRWKEPKIELLADNIFEFFKRVDLEGESDFYIKDLDNLYRNWNEDFWRVKGKDNPS